MDSSWQQRFLQDIKNKTISVFDRQYRLRLTEEQINKILAIPPLVDKLIDVKIEGDEVIINIFLISSEICRETIDEKKIYGVDWKLLLRKREKVYKILRYVDLFTNTVQKEEKIFLRIEEIFETESGEKLDSNEEIVEYLGLKVVSKVDVPTLRKNDYLSNYLRALYVFNDGTVIGYYGEKTVTEGPGETEPDFGFNEEAGETYEVPVFKFLNTSSIYNILCNVLNKIYAERLYKTAIKLYHKKENEEYEKQREQWINEFKEAQRKQEDLEKFLLNKRSSYFTKEEIEWLRNVSPVKDPMYIYFDGLNDIEVYEFLGRIKVKVGREQFEVPVK
jgi:hypothetical protein